MESISSRVQKGAAWMVLFKLADRGLGLLSTAILARLLAPEDFGLVAMAAVVMELLQVVVAFSFDMALISNRNARRAHYDTAWTLGIGLGAFLMIALLLLARPMAAFFGDPRLVLLMTVLSLRPLIASFENIGVVKFRKELRFNAEFKFLLANRLALTVATLALAFTLRTYWALAGGIVISSVCGVVISYVAHPYRPRLCLSERSELIGFSKWLLMNNAISFAYLRSASLVIGKQLGAAPLGIYELSNEIARIPTTELIAPINRAIFSGYAAVAEDPAALRRAFLRTIAVIAMFAIPAGAGLAAVADVLVSAILGPQWIEAGPLIRVLAVYGVVTALTSNTYYAHIALGDVRPFTALTAMSSVAVISLLLVLTPRSGLAGAALAFAIVAGTMFPVYYIVLMKKLRVRLADLARVFWRPVAAAALMGAGVAQAEARAFTGSSLEDLMVLAGLSALGAFLYCGIVLGLWILAGRPDGAEQTAIEKGAELARKVRSPFRRDAG